MAEDVGSLKNIQKAPGCIRVATFNVHFGRNPTAIAQLFKANENLAQADVVLLQEIEHRTREKLARTAKVARAMKWNYVYIPNRGAPQRPRIARHCRAQPPANSER